MTLRIQRYFSIVRFLWRSFRTYVGAIFLMLLLGLVSGFFESLGIASVIPLFYLVSNSMPLGDAGRISQIVQSTFSFLHIPLDPISLLSFIAGLFILKAIIQLISRYTGTRTVSLFEKKIRSILFRRTLRTNWAFLSRQKLGYLEGVLLYDVERATALFTNIVNSIITSTTFLMYVLVAMAISIRITLIVLALELVLFVCAGPFFARVRKLTSLVVRVQKNLNHHVAEHMLSAKSIKALAVEGPVITEADNIFEKLCIARVRTTLFRQTTLAIVEPLGFLLIAGLFLYSYQSPHFALASFAVIIYLINQMFGYLKTFQSQFHAINELIPYLRTTMKYRREISQYREEDRSTLSFLFEQSLSFENVSFSYIPGRPVLSGVSFTINRGEHVTIVGPSGAGKTTVVDLLLRLYEPEKGRILIDENNATTYQLRSWRRHIGYVPQDGLLLNTSVYENIRFYDKRVTKQDIIDAAKAANIYDTIMGLAQGFETVTGERGVQLSGGQRQRIILARALARKPQVIVFDEATSSIDSESEALIQKAVERLHGNVTIISITHRITSAMHSDRILVLDHGHITEQSTPEELAKNPSSYVSRLLELTEKNAA